MDSFSVTSRFGWVSRQLLRLPVVWFLVNSAIVLYLFSLPDAPGSLLAVAGCVLIVSQVVLWRLGSTYFLVGMLFIGLSCWRGSVAWRDPQPINTSSIIAIHGRITQVEQYTASTARYTIQAYVDTQPGPRIQVSTLPYPWFVAGDAVTVSCQFQEVPVERAYLVRSNISYTCTNAVLAQSGRELIPKSPWWSLIRACNRAIQVSWQRVEKLLGYPTAEMLFSMTIGLPIDIDHYEKLLRGAGLSHIISVSGYNLTVLSSLVVFLIPKHWRTGHLVGVLVVLMAFVIIAGFGSPVVRAGWMVGWQLLGNWFRRPGMLYNNLGWSIVLSLLCNPYELFSISLYLSVLALLGIAALVPIGTMFFIVIVSKLYQLALASPFMSFKVREGKRFPFLSDHRHQVRDMARWQELTAVSWGSIARFIVSNSAVLHHRFRWANPILSMLKIAQGLIIPTLAATMTTVGIIVLLFHSFTAWFLVGNVLVLPIVSVITVAGVVVLLLSLHTVTWTLMSSVSVFWGNWIYFLCEYMITVCERIEQLPLAQAQLSVSPGAILVYYLFVLIAIVTFYPLPRRV